MAARCKIHSAAYHMYSLVRASTSHDDWNDAACSQARHVMDRLMLCM